MKHIAILLALFMCAAACFADEEYFKTRLNIVSLADAINAYEGSWKGVQNLSSPDGRDIASFEIEQNYYWTVLDNQKVLVGQGFIKYAGNRIDMVSQMRLRKGYIELILTDVNGDSLYYKGVLDAESIIWTPLYSFFMLDVQKDEFRYDEKYVNFYSENLKFMRAGESDMINAMIGRTAMRKERAGATPENAGKNLIKRGKGSLFE